MPININQPGALKTGAPQIPSQPRQPGELQPEDVVAAQEIPGFVGERVFITLQKKTESKYFKKPNQDNILTDSETGLLGVMDGLGGHNKGDLASMAVEREVPIQLKKTEKETENMQAAELIEKITELTSGRYNGRSNFQQKKDELRKKAEEIVAKDIDLARKALLLLRAVQESNPAVAATGGATTACLGLVHKLQSGERYAIIANVGDSGAFIRRKNGELEKITEEDSSQQGLSDVGVNIQGMDINTFLRNHSDPISGRIPDSLTIPVPINMDNLRAIGYTRKTAEDWIKTKQKTLDVEYADLKRYVSSVMGIETPSPRLSLTKVETGDEILFCTDGIIDKYDDETKQELDLDELSKDLSVGNDPVERLDNLRVIAHQKTTYKDNDDVAMVLVAIE